MMEMHLYIAEAALAETGEGIQPFRLVALFREEEGVSRRSTIRVDNAVSDLLIAVDPCRHPGSLDLDGRVTVSRLIMIGETKENVGGRRTPRTHDRSTNLRGQESGKPELGVSGQRQWHRCGSRGRSGVCRCCGE